MKTIRGYQSLHSSYFVLCVQSLLLALMPYLAFGSQQLQQTNLLFIIFDDLRTELSIYGRMHMITPNFERLAKQSVTFDNAYTQIAVCNPSRDSLMTGLRPDTLGVYDFQDSFRPHVTFPTQLISSGYNTAGFGKILHWESNDRGIWNFDSWENDWYTYQNAERAWMNASTMPDKIKPEHHFRDYEFTTRLIDSMKKMHSLNQYFMAAIGFKLPHLAVHIPHKYYEMYKGKSASWALSKKELRYPFSAPTNGYRCCPEPEFVFMENEGAKRSEKKVYLGDINTVFTERMHDELMMGYCGAITFTDKLLGMILDTVDDLKLWNNITIILTADHGMHNGEKGTWEKWTTYDESTRVPLLISHPQSPYKGQHYPHPVELVDIYPTVTDLLGLSFDRKSSCPNGWACVPLSGKSLAPAVLGSSASHHDAKAADKKAKKSIFSFGGVRHLTSVDVMDDPQVRRLDDDYTKSLMIYANTSYANSTSPIPPLPMTIAISQHRRCALRRDVMAEAESIKKSGHMKTNRRAIWRDCSDDRRKSDDVAILGYSMRSLDFRYTGWFHLNLKTMTPLLDVPPYNEELYDHRGETPLDYTHLELVNLVHRPGYEHIISSQRQKLIDFIKKNIVFRGAIPGKGRV